MLRKASALSALAVAGAGTASAADCSGVNEWNSGAAYTGGDQVTYDGSLWTAEWWTKGTQPAESENVWTLEGSCGGSSGGDSGSGVDCSSVSAWDSGTAYTGGDQVTYDGSLWTAEWWTKGTQPAESENVWTLEGACGDGGNDGGDGGNDGGDQNQSPDASFTVSPSSPEPGEEVTLDASGSSDPDGDSLSYEWNIETVGTVEGAVNTLTLDAGNYEVTLTVTDADGASSSVTETLTVAEAPDGPTDEFKVIGYYPGWKATPEYDYYPEDIPFDKVTHVQYAFLGVDADNAVPTIMSDQDRQNLERFKELKDGAASDTKITLSVGGWADSTGFSEIAMTESGRQSFADRCVEILRKYNLDGIDIDWEHPGSSQGKCQCGSNKDYENHVKLLQALRDTLDAAAKEDGKYYELSIANGGSDWNAGGLRHGDIGEICDFASIMAYDFTGSWMDVVGQNAPLYGDAHPTENSQYGETYNAQYFVEYSVDKLYAGDHGEVGYWPGQWEYPPAEPAAYDELVLGLPFYGRGFNGTEMYGSYSGLPQGTWHDQLEDGADPTGAFDFGDLEENFEGADGWTKKRHDPGATPYIVNESEETIISYDDEKAIEEKVKFAKERGMSGVMFWELSQDWNETLLDTINRTA